MIDYIFDTFFAHKVLVITLAIVCFLHLFTDFLEIEKIKSRLKKLNKIENIQSFYESEITLKRSIFILAIIGGITLVIGVIKWIF